MYSNRTKKILQLLEPVSADTEVERNSSPLTESQEIFVRNHENEDDYQYCLKELSHLASKEPSPEGSPTILNFSQFEVFDSVEQLEPSPYRTDGDSSTNWTPPKRTLKTIKSSVLDSNDSNSSKDTFNKPSTSGLSTNYYLNQKRRTTIISSSDESDLENLPNSEYFQNGKKKSRKRLCDKKNWKREVAKKKRLEGEQYLSAVSKTNKIIKQREMKDSCPNSCKLKCFNKITNDCRRMQFDIFWKTMINWDQRRQFVASSINLVPVMRPRRQQNNETSRRKHTRIYNINIDGERVRVCQKMFLNTFSLTEQFISTTLAKMTENSCIVQPDQRGKHVPGNKTPDVVIAGIKQHISAFPRYICHYSREKTRREYLGPELNIVKMYELYVQKCKEDSVPENMIAKQWLYRKVFNEYFNLSFYLPSNDTCDTCDKYISLLKLGTNDEEKRKIDKDRTDHLKDANNRYSLKRKDKENARASGGKSVTLMMDMQKCLATPLLTNSQSFYLRKLWTFNETIHNDTDNKSYCMMWDETQGGRGANKVGSCIIEWVLNYKEEKTEEITIWSDNCSGQNRNVILLYCYFWLLQNTGLVTINHKFLLRGHTHSEADVVHSVIERKKKELSCFDIVVPRDWKQFIKICKTKNPLVVHSMDIFNIKNIKSLTSYFSQRRRNSKNEPFFISQCVWLQVRKGSDGILFYKKSFNDEEFSEINLKKNVRQNLLLPNNLPQVNQTLRSISSPKYKDLVTLTQWIADPDLKKFYINLSHGNTTDIFEESENQD